MPKHHILIIASESEEWHPLQEYLEIEECDVSRCEDVSDSIRELREKQIDLVIVDRDCTSALKFVKLIRKNSQVPIIVISGVNTESDRITAFESGVDDYLMKPVSLRELVLRSRRILDRSRPGMVTGEMRTYEHGKRRLSIGLDRHALAVDGMPVRVTAAEWNVLVVLVQSQGKVLSREQILETCFSYETDSYNRIVDTHIKNLRRKLHDRSWIETVRGFGYRFSGASADPDEEFDGCGPIGKNDD